MPGWIHLLEPEELNKSLKIITKSKVNQSGGDFRDILHSVKNNSLGMVLTDMPWDYESKQVTWNMEGGRRIDKLELPYPTLTYKDTKVLLKLIYKKLKMNRNCWLWSDWRHVPILIKIAEQFGFRYFGLCVAVRKRVGMGKNIRKRCYFVVGLSKGSVSTLGYLEEYLGEFTFIGSTKPWEANFLLLRHSLPSGEKWLDPFPATHTEVPKKIRELQSSQLSRLYKTRKMRKSDIREVI